MKKVYHWALVLCLLTTLGSCTQKQNHKGKKPLVEVAGKFLYQEDLQAALPLNLVSDARTDGNNSIHKSALHRIGMRKMQLIINMLMPLFGILAGREPDKVKEGDLSIPVIEFYEVKLFAHNSFTRWCQSGNIRG